MQPPTLLIQTIAMSFTVLGWAVLAVALVFPLLTRRGRTQRRDSWSIAGMALQGVAFALVFAVHVTWSKQGLMQFVSAALSALLTIVGVSFTVTAIRTLGKQWSLTARVLEQHQLITRGPYAIVRHPIYSGLLALLLATGASMSSVLVTGCAVVFYIAGTLLRTTREERLLRSMFGAEYEQYAKKVPALIPRHLAVR